MIAIVECAHEDSKKNGRDPHGKQRMKCRTCGKRWVQQPPKPLGDIRTDSNIAFMVLRTLLECGGVRSTARIFGVSKNTVQRIMLQAGEACERFLPTVLKDVPVQDVEIDEIWSWCFVKESRKTERHDESHGDMWTFMGIESNSKLLLAHHVGKRNGDSAWEFLNKLKYATSGHFQITADGWASYERGIPFMFRKTVDFGQLIKEYRSSNARQYAPAAIIRSKKLARLGNPDWDRISTSGIERFNGIYRDQMKRFARLTKGFSKSARHHEAMQSLFIAYYDFVRPHSSIGGDTPAMRAGLADHRWSLEELLTEASR